MAFHTRILLFGDAPSCQKALSGIQEAMGDDAKVNCVENLEEMTAVLVDWDPTLIIVVADGAEGMECVYRARERRPCLPVFWFSDDRDFSVISYRLECAYFSTKPPTAEKLQNALQRCRRLGIRYTG